ncbi:MAG: acyl-CoA thioesterase [Anaerolineae bacterium]|nr:acyl-CoA thioesterase [Anaerolineae bacterium]
MSDELFRFATTVEVRWRDLDAMNHVNNAVYFTYLEQARVHYLRELGLIPEMPSGVGFILAEARCQYTSPLTLGERVTVRIRVSDLGRSSFVFTYRMEGQDGRLVAEARSTQVCYDYGNERSIPLSDAWRQAILAFEPGLSSQTT